MHESVLHPSCCKTTFLAPVGFTEITVRYARIIWLIYIIWISHFCLCGVISFQNIGFKTHKKRKENSDFSAIVLVIWEHDYMCLIQSRYYVCYLPCFSAVFPWCVLFCRRLLSVVLFIRSVKTCKNRIIIFL